MRRTTPRFCSTSRTVVSSASRSSTRATSATSAGARPFVGSSTSRTRLSFRSARAIATICCCPPESVPARCCAALLELREELVDEVVARLRVALGEPEVLRDGEPGEDVAVLRHVADACGGRSGASTSRVSSSPVELDRAAAVDETENRAQRRRLADAVAAEQRRDAALRHVERHALQDVRLPEVHVQVVARRAASSKRPRSQLLAEVGGLHGLVRHHRSRRVARRAARRDA